MTQKSSQYQKILAAIVSTVNYNTASKIPEKGFVRQDS